MIAFLADHWQPIVAGFVACALVIGTLMHNAQEGWEDEAGFHRGPWHDTKAEERKEN